VHRQGRHAPAPHLAQRLRRTLAPAHVRATPVDFFNDEGAGLGTAPRAGVVEPAALRERPGGAAWEARAATPANHAERSGFAGGGGDRDPSPPLPPRAQGDEGPRSRHRMGDY